MRERDRIVVNSGESRGLALASPRFLPTLFGDALMPVSWHSNLDRRMKEATASAKRSHWPGLTIENRALVTAYTEVF